MGTEESVARVPPFCDPSSQKDIQSPGFALHGGQRRVVTVQLVSITDVQ